jgi:hypothetical protein
VVLGLLAWATAWAQLPPLPPLPPLPGLDDLFGAGAASGAQVVQTLLELGMSHTAGGAPPFGTDAAGAPRWPLGEPFGPTSSVAAPASPGIISSLGGPEGGGAGDASAVAILEKINELPAAGRCDPAVVRPLIAAPVSLARRRRMAVGDAPLAAADLNRMRVLFLLDLQQHARHVWEGKPGLALAVAFKWRVLDRLFPDQIDEITFHIARRKGFPSFAAWIEAVIAEDRRYVGTP